MNTVQQESVSTSTNRPSGIRLLSGVRSQAALVRALLDEIERVAPPGATDAIDEQLIEELARLGCRCIEVASNLTSVIGEHDPSRMSPRRLPRCA